MITAQRKAAVPFRDYSYLPLPFKLPSFRFHGTRKLEYQRTGSFFKQQENILVLSRLAITTMPQSLTLSSFQSPFLPLAVHKKRSPYPNLLPGIGLW